MKETTHHPAAGNLRRHATVVVAVFLALALLAACVTYQDPQNGHATAAAQSWTTISQSELEGHYGLRVMHVAVTAASGLVDVRIAITDAEKAREFLKDRADMPVLVVGNDDGVTLKSSEQSADGGLNLSDGGMILKLFPNIGNAVKPGVPVSLAFADVRLEPIIAR